MRYKTHISAMLMGVSFAAIGASASAQDANESAEPAIVDEIIVTARFREETVQDIGLSVGAISGTQIQERGLEDFQDLARTIAGVQVIKIQPNTNDISIRGVQNAQYSNGDTFTTSPLVSIFVDDIAVVTPGSSQRDFNFFDMSRVEFLRGPQPTLFGEGAVGGAVRYFTADPDLSGPRITGIAHSRVSDYEDGSLAYRVENATSFIAVPDKLGFRVMGFYRDDGGFIDNPTLGEDDINDYETFGGRATMLARPTDNLEVRLSAFVSRDEIGEQTQIDIGSDPDDLTFASAPLSGRTEDDFDLYSGRVTYDLGNIELSSITGLYTRDTVLAAFSAANTFGLPPFFPGFDTTSFSFAERSEETFSQEFRAVTNWEGSLNFTAGLFYQQTDLDRIARVNSPGLLTAVTPQSENIAFQSNTIDVTQLSGFLEGTLEVNDRLRLTAGARYVDESFENTLNEQNVVDIGFILQGNPGPVPFTDSVADLTSVGLDTTFEFNLGKFLPRGGIEFDVSDDTLLYANIATGVRNGNLNSPSSIRPLALNPDGSINEDRFFDLLRIEEDDILSIDAGLKNTLMDGRWILNVGAFYSKYDDTQITVALPANAVLNGADQRIYGLELETNFKLSDAIDLFGNLTLLDTEFTDDFSSVSGLPISFVDVPEGSEAGNQPNLSFSLGYQSNVPIGSSGWAAKTQAAFSYIGERFSQPQNVPSTKLDSLELLNIGVGIENDTFAITLFMDNVFNDIEQTAATSSVIAPTGFDANGAPIDFNPIFASVNAPRSIGVDLTVRY
ncbi:TonB-dependent receptor [uncultured Algimonas sp.]|uniref:TonB-dependent receptor n=1 Tax=uncultured Algimonas sp. TaxID=1547920 RepID=UPI002638881C|nr:TonB-dependent receptor [uncultured Algimonas sp.]